MNLDICWWNTRLTPPTGGVVNKPIDSSFNSKFEEILRYIINEKPLDIIILCEVYERDEPLIAKVAKELDMSFLMIAKKISGVYYDFAIIYEKTKVEIKSYDFIDEENSFEQQLRVGAIAEAKFDGDDVTIFLSHWNSDSHDGEEKKSYCSGKLRDKINSYFKKEIKLLFLAGDYNLQPYDKIIRTTLDTTKDLDILKSRPRVLYNPFWRNLDSRSENHKYQGSYRYDKDRYDKWKTYDQMMFSSSFIHGDSWILDIYSTEIHDEFRAISFNYLDYFDHVPIYARISK